MARFLVVDECPAPRAAMRQALRVVRPDADVQEADDGPKAVEAFRGGGVEVVFAALRTGDASGSLELVRSLTESQPEAKVVLYTARGEDDELVREAFNLGAAGYVPKPLRVQQLRRVMADIWADHPAAGRIR